MRFASKQLEALKRRDPVAQADFWAIQRAGLIRTCAAIVKTDADAADIADGVLIDFLFGHVDNIRHAEAVRAYVQLMAARRAVRFRKRAHQITNGVDQLVDSENLELSGEQALVLKRVTECAERLTHKARTVLRLRYRGDLTNERIGALVGGSKQYIGRLLTRSLSTLRECLQAHQAQRQERQERSA